MHVDEFRALGHRIIDRLADHLETIEERPLFPSVEPRTLLELLDEPVPRGPMTGDGLMEELERTLFPYLVEVNHPGYFGLITPSALPLGALGDLIASTLNPLSALRLHCT